MSARKPNSLRSSIEGLWTRQFSVPLSWVIWIHSRISRRSFRREPRVPVLVPSLVCDIVFFSISSFQQFHSFLYKPFDTSHRGEVAYWPKARRTRGHTIERGLERDKRWGNRLGKTCTGLIVDCGMDGWGRSDGGGYGGLVFVGWRGCKAAIDGDTWSRLSDSS